jgi:hypothetical protein
MIDALKQSYKNLHEIERGSDVRDLECGRSVGQLTLGCCGAVDDNIEACTSAGCQATGRAIHV